MDTTLTLGSFTFQNYEIPEKINFGGDQSLVKHQLIGGFRVVDALGKNDTDISWSGLMFGPDALTRAQALNKLRANGQQLTLKWFNLSYQVVIASFTANTERYYQVAYDISLAVISDGDNPNATQNLVGFNEAINSDFTAANALASSIDIPSVTSSVADLGQAITDIPTLNGATPQEIASVQTPLDAALTSVNSAIQSTQTQAFGS